MPPAASGLVEAALLVTVEVEPPSLIRDKALGGNGNASRVVVSAWEQLGGGQAIAVGGPEPSVPSRSITGGGGGGETDVDD